MRPFAPAGPAGPCGPAGPWGPVAPTVPVPVLPAARAISSSGECAVWSFSLLSNWRTGEAAGRTRPLLLDGEVTQDWTAEVTSRVMNSPGAGTSAEPMDEPVAGRVLKVTLYSPQDELTLA